jgi:pimeloyl-ACP methyl ester carboxylesterase
MLSSYFITSVQLEAIQAQNEVGILTSLLGPGGECEGYALRFVGHSLGGSIAILTALRVIYEVLLD